MFDTMIATHRAIVHIVRKHHLNDEVYIYIQNVSIYMLIIPLNVIYCLINIHRRHNHIQIPSQGLGLELNIKTQC